MQALLVLALALALFIAVFTLQNAELIDIRLLFWRFTVSKVLVILGSAFAGALAVLLVGIFHQRKKKEKAGEEPAPTIKSSLFSKWRQYGHAEQKPSASVDKADG